MDLEEEKKGQQHETTFKTIEHQNGQTIEHTMEQTVEQTVEIVQSVSTRLYPSLPVSTRLYPSLSAMGVVVTVGHSVTYLRRTRDGTSSACW